MVGAVSEEEDGVSAVQCPECGKSSTWNESFERFFHLDGTNNGKCWRREAVR